MQRPVLNPTFLDEQHDDEMPREPWMRKMRRALLIVWRLLLKHPFSRRRNAEMLRDDRPLSTRLTGAALRWLVFTPLLVTMLIAAMVWHGTHPTILPDSTTPTSLGIYYDPVSFVADDGTRLEGWLVPVVDARTVLSEQDKILRRKWPAAVLVHDQRHTQAQMLPLVKPLHEAGVVVLVLATRGDGRTTGTASTFGLRESRDVAAAVEVLRRRPFVDSGRIAVVGSGTGANAAILAIEKDPGIRVTVLDAPISSVEEILTTIGPRHDLLTSLRPMCKWTFELAFQVDADQLNLGRYQNIMRDRKVLMVSHSDGTWPAVAVEQVAMFLRENGIRDDASLTALAR